VESAARAQAKVGESVQEATVVQVPVVELVMGAVQAAPVEEWVLVEAERTGPLLQVPTSGLEVARQVCRYPM
jgi:hypothetical protein